MSLQTNGNLIDECITLANSLPDAGSGAALETFNVGVYGCKDVFYTSVENGEIVSKTSIGSSTMTNHNIVVCKNSTVTCGRMLEIGQITGTGAELLTSYGTYYSVWKVTGGTSSIEIHMSQIQSGGSG